MRRITLRDCIVASSAYYEIHQKKLTGNCRQARYAVPRQVTMHVARRLTGLSYPRIAGRLGNRDHSTIIHGDRLIAGLKESDLQIRKAIIEICTRLYDDLYRDQMNAAWGIGKACLALCKRKNKAVPKTSPVFIERLSLPDVKAVMELPRTRAPRPVHALEPSMIPAPSKARLMGARA